MLRLLHREPIARHVPLALSLALLLAPATPTPAQELDQETRAAVIEAAASGIEADYIYEDKAHEIAAALRAATGDGAFDDATSSPAVGEALSRFLLEISDDRHLRVWYQPEIESPEPRPRSRTIDRTHGVRGVEVLEGNVGLLDLRGFAGGDDAKPRIDSALRLLSDVDALIIDLRANGGGQPWMVRYLSAFLFAEPTHLVTTWMRGWDEPVERWTAEDLGVPPRPELPVYVLTGPRTFSAAESFTFGLKAHDRVTTVGERTGGGGHFGQVVTLPAGFQMFVPTGRSYDPRTKKGWEAAGIAPDVSVATDDALQRAHELALGATVRGDGDLAGAWSGSLESASGSARLTIRLHGTGDDYEATLVDHRHQREVLLDRVHLERPEIRIDYAPAGVQLRLRIGPDANSLDGVWAEDGEELSLRLERR